MRRLVTFLFVCMISVSGGIAAAADADLGGGLVPIDVVQEAILAGLADKGVDTGDAVLDLATPITALAIPDGGMLVAERMSYQPRTRRFAAVLGVVAGNATVKRLSVAGRMHRMVHIPVLTRRLERDETIGADDIRWLTLRDRRLPGNAVLDAEDLLGMAGRRPLRPGIPVLLSDVRRPILVRRGSLVTMVMNDGALQLTARGRALEDGGQGETVRISNLQSGRVIVATVTDPGVASVAGSQLFGKDSGS